MDRVVLVCGSRAWNDINAIRRRLKRLPRGTVLRSGMAKGADIIAASVGDTLGFRLDPVPADWYLDGKYDPQAGFKRNTLMLDKKPKPCYVISWWDRESTGTLDTIVKALERSITTEVQMKDYFVVLEDSDDLESLVDEAQNDKAQRRIEKAIKAFG